MDFVAKDGKTYSIRKAGVRDAEGVCEYFKIVSFESEECLLLSHEEVKGITPQDEKEWIENRNKNGFIGLITPKNQREIIAISDLRYPEQRATKHKCELGISVKKSYQGIGIGYNFLVFMINQAKLDEKRRIELSLCSENTRGLSLYKKLGFEIEGKKIKSLYKKGKYQDEILMAKNI